MAPLFSSSTKRAVIFGTIALSSIPTSIHACCDDGVAKFYPRTILGQPSTYDPTTVPYTTPEYELFKQAWTDPQLIKQSALGPNQCGSIKRQSPIDLSSKQLESATLAGETRSLSDIYTTEPEVLGVAEKAKFRGADRHYHIVYPPRVAGRKKNRVAFWEEAPHRRHIDATYELWQMHAHFPAEHSVDGKLTDAELHLVHKHACLDDDGAAVAGVQCPGGNALAVVGVRLVRGSSNSKNSKSNGNLLAKLLTWGTSSKYEPFTLDLEQDLFKKLDGGNRAYWTYEGSLTSPPCLETVKWIVMQDTLTVDPATFDALQAGNTRMVFHQTDPVVPALEDHSCTGHACKHGHKNHKQSSQQSSEEVSSPHHRVITMNQHGVTTQQAIAVPFNNRPIQPLNARPIQTYLVGTSNPRPNNVGGSGPVSAKKNGDEVENATMVFVLVGLALQITTLVLFWIFSKRMRAQNESTLEDTSCGQQDTYKSASRRGSFV